MAASAGDASFGWRSFWSPLLLLGFGPGGFARPAPPTGSLADCCLSARWFPASWIGRSGRRALGRYRPEAASAEPQRMSMPPIGSRPPIFPNRAWLADFWHPCRKDDLRTGLQGPGETGAARFRPTLSQWCVLDPDCGRLHKTNPRLRPNRIIECDRDDDFPPVGASTKSQSSSSSP